jgi:large subunit ribosomal protein L25
VVDYVIDAEARSVTGKKVGALRRSGVVPATIYGPKQEPVNVQIPYRPLEIALLKAGGSHLIELITEGKGQTVLVRDVQRHTLTHKIMHVDFFALDMKSKLRTDIPVHYVGESPAVAAKLGVLVTGPTTLYVELLPSKLMDHIAVDVSGLSEVGAAVHVSDLNLGDDVVILNDPDELLARVTQTAAARADEDVEAAEEEELSSSAEPEVVKRGRAEDDEED